MADDTTTDKGRTRANAPEKPDDSTSQQAAAERSLTGTDEPFVVRTIPDDATDNELNPGPLKVNGTDGAVLEAANGLAYAGVSEDWVRLTPKD